MSPQSNTGNKSFEAGTALVRGIRVKLSSGTIIASGLGEKGIGQTTDSGASGDFVNVRMDGHSVEAIASGSITENANCYAAAAGDVSATISGPRVGIALEAASDTELFEMMRAGVTS